MIFSCSDSEKFKKPQPQNLKCPSCGEKVKVWTDEIQAICPNCKNTVIRPQEQSCLEWCSYVKECVGVQKYTLYMHNKATSIKEKLLRELEDYFGGGYKTDKPRQKCDAFC